jgi:hypothetical protein
VWSPPGKPEENSAIDFGVIRMTATNTTIVLKESLDILLRD